MSKIQVGHRLSSPYFPLRRRPDNSTPLDDFSVYELMDYLWEHMIDREIIPAGRGLKQRVSELQDFDVVSGSSSTWYSVENAKNVPKAYLLALALQTQKHEAGQDEALFPVRHFESQAYYSLAAKAAHAGRRLAIEDRDALAARLHGSLAGWLFAILGMVWVTS